MNINFTGSKQSFRFVISYFFQNGYVSGQFVMVLRLLRLPHIRVRFIDNRPRNYVSECVAYRYQTVC